MSLFDGLLRVLGTDDISLVAAATSPYGACYGAQCFESPCKSNLEFIRQCIPEPLELPTRLLHPAYAGEVGSDGRPSTLRCLCGKKLKHAHVAYLIEDPGRNALVGSCCILLFEDAERRGRACQGCHAPHKNRADNYCGACRAQRIEQATAVAARASATALSAQRASAVAGQASARAAGYLEKVRTHIHACIGCGAKGVKIPFVKCYNCNAAALTGKCSTCSKPCRPAYKKCWGCK